MDNYLGQLNMVFFHYFLGELSHYFYGPIVGDENS